MAVAWSGVVLWMCYCIAVVIYIKSIAGCSVVKRSSHIVKKNTPAYIL